MSLNNHNPKMTADKSSPNTNSENGKPGKSFDILHSLKRIGIYAGAALLISAGIGFGLLGRLYYQPLMISYRFDGFSASLPFKPTAEEITGIPPFSGRRIIQYRVIVAPGVEYQILVMDLENSKSSDNKVSDIDFTTVEREIEQWAETTIAVLCADEESRSIRTDCLQSGSRLTRWSLITSGGLRVHGSARRTRSGKIIQLLASGTTDEDTLDFFESFKPE